MARTFSPAARAATWTPAAATLSLPAVEMLGATLMMRPPCTLMTRALLQPGAVPLLP